MYSHYQDSLNILLAEKWNNSKEIILKSSGILMLEKTLESPLDSKMKPVSPKGNRPWIFIGRTYAEAEGPILWPPDVKSQRTGKDPDAGNDWRPKGRQKIEGNPEDEMVQLHGWLKEHGCEQTLETVEDRGTWCAAVRGATKTRAQRRDWATATASDRQVNKERSLCEKTWNI